MTIALLKGRDDIMLRIEDFYPKNFYTPMPEMYNENIPVTAGCGYDLCKFCDLNGLLKFEVFDIEKVKQYIKDRAEFYQGQLIVPKKFTLLEGNALCCDTNHLLEIMHTIHQHFPQVDYISSFARSMDVLDKSMEDLQALKEAGLDRLSIGIESGSDEVLRFQRKGVRPKDQLRALKKLEEAGIRYTCYIMIGLGGKRWSHDHALDTARFLNQVHPDELTVVTMVLFKGADLVKDVVEGRFKRLSVLESLQEERLLLSHLSLSTIFNGTHPTNALAIKGKLPEQKELLLDKLDQLIEEKEDDKHLALKEAGKWKHI